MIFPVTDWEMIPLDTYKALLVEVKERFNTTTDETVSCTDKSIKCLLASITFTFGVGVFLYSNHFDVNWWLFSPFLALTILNSFLGYSIIRLRPSYTSGLLPENVLSKDYNSETGFTDEEKERLFYYKAIITYTTKIEENTRDNTKRAEKYDTFFGFTILLVSAIGLFVLYVISYHHGSAAS